jgi:predicted nucleic acid-binding protein
LIIVDTNVISELMRNAPAKQVEQWLSEQDGASVYITAITEAELRFGVAILPTGKRQTYLANLVESILEEDFHDRILPFDRKAAIAFASIAAERRSVGRPISQFDGQIAAIARSLSASVATRNTADFEGCGIDVLNPWVLGLQ